MEIAPGGADDGLGAEKAASQRCSQTRRQHVAGKAMQSKPGRRHQTDLHHGQGCCPKEPHQGRPQQQHRGEVLSKALIGGIRGSTAMKHSTGELRGEAGGKPAAMGGVPQHLAEDALVVRRRQRPPTPELHQQPEHGKQQCRTPDPAGWIPR